MKYYFLSFIYIIFTTNYVAAQQYEKVVVNDKDITSGYYLAFKPTTDTITSVLFLLDGFGGAPESIQVESKLPNIAATNGILTIAASMGQKIYADSMVISKLNLLLQDVVQRYHVSRDKFVLGGFSAGGTIALRYVELCKENHLKYPINPKAVFTIDSPVDIIELWSYFQEQIEKNYSDIAVDEAKYVSALMQQEYGKLTTNLQQYQWLTPFNHVQKEVGNEQFLKDIPVRVYHDVDIVWRLKNRMQSGYDANFLVASELILRLMAMKNTAAEFVQGRTGYRSNGMRHPHSWNIVDEVECIQWIMKIFSN